MECLTTIWEWKGCLGEGTKAPVKLETNETEALDLLNVEYVNIECYFYKFLYVLF